MRTTILAALATAGTLTALAAPATAYATPTHTSGCGAVVHDHIAKTDSGHGTPAEWADLNLARTTSIRCIGPGKYVVTLLDRGTLKTKVGAGTPNGTGGQITNAVPGKVAGIYRLTVHGQLAVPAHRDTSLASTAYVTSLFAQGAEVTGGPYAWGYTTGCERWLDSSKNNDGQGAAAGNITGKICKPNGHPTPTPTPTSPGGNGGGTPTTVPSGAPQTGDGSSQGGSNTGLMLAGALVVLLGLGGAGGWTILRRRGQH